MMTDLLIALAFSMGFNLLMFLPAYFLQTDKLTDLSYSLSFILLSSYLFFTGEWSLTSLMLYLLVMLWALRVGTYLFVRIHKMGRDTRFDEMRSKWPNFLGFWTLQGLSVFIISIPFILVFTGRQVEFNVLSSVGMGIGLTGLILESVADYQKFRWKVTGNELWIESGLWKFVRFPNYLGEILFWTGLYLYVISGLSGFEIILAAASPLFITILLRFISGIPLLEESQEKRYGHHPDFQAYKQRTGRLLPGL